MATKRLPVGGNKFISGDTAAKANAAMSAANNPFAWLVGFFLVAILVVAVLASALIGSNVAANNSLLNQMQSRVTPPVNASCDSKAEERRTRAYQLRVNAAFDQYARRVECHERNNDETLYASQNYYASYSKLLPHDALGHVNVSAFQQLLKAASTGLPSEWDKVPLAPGSVYKLTNPLAGEAFVMEGGDAHSFYMKPAPAFASAEHAADMVENYWMALLRDVPFANYSTHPLALQAIADLNNLTDYKGLKPVTAQNLFRGVESGCTDGPMISQFLYLPCPYGATYIEQKIKTYTAGLDFMTTFSEYLSVQNGQSPTGIQTLDPTPVFLRNGRDLGRWVHMDVLYQGYFMAALNLIGTNAPLKSSLPYQVPTNSAPFGTFGAPFIMQLSANSATAALKAAWFSKWNVHRRLRPENTGARVDRHKRGLYTYSIHSDLLNSNAASVINSTYGGWLLPQAYAEGCPSHGSYGAGHATVAGAAVTLLKAFYNESHVIQNPMMPNPLDNGQTLVPLFPSANLTIGGELNKIAANIALGRDFSGVHYRSDYYHSLRLGEQVAISILRDLIKTFAEPLEGVFFTSFDGQVITIKK